MSEGLLFVATSNFIQAIDEAMLSRADLIVPFHLVSADVAGQIITRNLRALAAAWPTLLPLAEDTASIARLAKTLAGWDGRKAGSQKLPLVALARRPETVRDPGALTMDDLYSACEELRPERFEHLTRSETATEVIRITWQLQTDPRIDYRTLIARAIRILNSRGVMHKSGHVAARDASDPNVMWINSRKASRSTLTAADVVPVDLKSGERIGEGDEPPSEFHIHRAIFNRRPEVGAIVHSHPEHIVALSIARRPLLPVTVDGAFLGARTPLFDDAGHIDTPELRGDAGGRRARILECRRAARSRGGDHRRERRARRHADHPRAEENAAMQYLAEAARRGPAARAPTRLARIAAHTASPKSIRKAWHYEEETARRRGDLEGA